MTTLDFVSTSTDGIRHTDDPLISMTAVLANLGSHPALTVPMITGEMPDVNWMWDYLAEPADFFGTAIPTRDELRVACERFTTTAAATSNYPLTAVTIVLIEVDGHAQFVVSGCPARRFDPAPVRIAVGGEGSPFAPRDPDPLWWRMAARTTSRSEVDQLARWCNDHGFVDQVDQAACHPESFIGPTALGAIVFDDGNGWLGLDNSCRPNVLRLMEQCGAIELGMITGAIGFVDSGQVLSAWWISPCFETHPVESIGDVHYRVESASPPTFLGRLP